MPCNALTWVQGKTYMGSGENIHNSAPELGIVSPEHPLSCSGVELGEVSPEPRTTRSNPAPPIGLTPGSRSRSIGPCSHVNPGTSEKSRTFRVIISHSTPVRPRRRWASRTICSMSGSSRQTPARARNVSLPDPAVGARNQSCNPAMRKRHSPSILRPGSARISARRCTWLSATRK
jgi:hypothetical protein